MQFLVTFGLVINASLAFSRMVDTGIKWTISFVPTKSSYSFSKINPFKMDT